MPATKKATEPGTLVTVRIIDADGETHTFHGNVVETVALHTQSWEDHSGTRYNYVPANERTAADKGFGKPEQWLRVYSATGKPFPIRHTGGWGINTHRLANPSADSFFDLYDFHVRTDSENVDVRVATKEGRMWVNANLSIDKRRALLVEQIKALDPSLAEQADRLMGDIDEDAFDRGRDAEWRSNNH